MKNSGKSFMPRSRMPLSDRAKQFAPFSALSGLDEALKRKELEHSRTERREMTDDRAAVVNERLRELYTGELIEVTYYCYGHYRTVKGVVSEIDNRGRRLIVDGTEIHFKDLYDINCR